MKALFFTAICLSLSSSALAGQIKGPGAGTCGTWLESRSNGSWRDEYHWVQGFISAYNHYFYMGDDQNGVFGHADPAAIAAWLDNYCRDNPLNTIYEGTIELIDELNGRAAN